MPGPGTGPMPASVIVICPGADSAGANGGKAKVKKNTPFHIEVQISGATPGEKMFMGVHDLNDSCWWAESQPVPFVNGIVEFETALILNAGEYTFDVKFDSGNPVSISGGAGVVAVDGI